MRWLVALALAVTVAAGGCGGCNGCSCRADRDPVDVPFAGVDPSSRPGSDLPPLDPLDTQSGGRGAPSSGSGPRGELLVPEKAQPAGSGGTAATGLEDCCAILKLLRRTGPDDGARAMYAQASLLCARGMQEIRDGKLNKREARARVRNALIGPIPSSCQ